MCFRCSRPRAKKARATFFSRLPYAARNLDTISSACCAGRQLRPERCGCSAIAQQLKDSLPAGNFSYRRFWRLTSEWANSVFRHIHPNGACTGVGSCYQCSRTVCTCTQQSEWLELWSRLRLLRHSEIHHYLPKLKALFRPGLSFPGATGHVLYTIHTTPGVLAFHHKQAVGTMATSLFLPGFPPQLFYRK